MISRGYSFQQEVLYRCRKAGCRIGETPIVFVNRQAGQSKANRREAVRSISLIFYIGLRCSWGWIETRPQRYRMLKLWLLLVPFALVVLAAGYDVLRRVIPNWVPVALVAWAVATAALGWHPQQGWLPLLYGFGMALAVALVLYAARSLDGGDVKLLAALVGRAGPAAAGGPANRHRRGRVCPGAWWRSPVDSTSSPIRRPSPSGSWPCWCCVFTARWGDKRAGAND